MRFSEKLRHLLQQSSGLLFAAILFAAVDAHGQTSSTVDECNITEKQSSDIVCIFYGGPIITYGQGLDDKHDIKQGVAIKGAEIIGLYTDSHTDFTLIDFDAMRRKLKEDQKYSHIPDEKIRGVYLRGATMIPGFVDAHSHFAQVGFLSEWANLLPEPDADKEIPVKSIKDILTALKKLRDDEKKKYGCTDKPDDCLLAAMTEKGAKAIIGSGYDDSMLVEQRHPTVGELNEVSTTVPVCIFHQSGHYGVCNTVGLNKAGYFDSPPTDDPLGGTIYRDKETGHMTGKLGEVAFIKMLGEMSPKLDEATLLDAEKMYTSQGFTTVQEGRVMDPAVVLTLSKAKLTVDVVGYADLQMVAKTEDGEAWMSRGEAWMSNWMSRDYSVSANGHFRMAGVKLTLDGSPQGRSAWFKDNYDLPPDGEKDYKGIANYGGKDDMEKQVAEKRLKELLIRAYRNRWQVMVHANGDAAIQQLIRVDIEAQRAMGAKDRRTTLIHGQFLRANQIELIKGLHIFPSLFPMHTFYWGDWYRTILGEKRAEFISPTKAVLNKGMKFSIHSDAPITKPNSMRLLDSAVNRTTRSGFVLGPEQRISPIVALKALTIWAAYQQFDEKTIGSIEAGKKADFVILSHNPLTVAHEDLICIQILQTIKDGQQIYKNPDARDASAEKFAKCAAPPSSRREKHP